MSPGGKTLTAGLLGRRGGDELLGADGVVALAPAQRRVVLDHRAQPEDAVHQRLGARRAAGHVHVDRHELVGGHDRVVVEDAHRRRAGAHRDRVLRLEHLVVDAPDDRRHLDRDAAGDDEQVGLARRGAEGLEAEARDVHARGDDRHHLDRAAGQAEGRREQRVAARPADGLVERRGEDRARGRAARAPGPRARRAASAARGSWRTLKSSGGLVTSRAGLSPFERSSPPHVDEGHEEQRDEDDRLDEGEGPERAQLDRDRVEEDDLDVEEDEEHRDQVEADPEAEALLDVGGQPALVGVGLAA